MAATWEASGPACDTTGGVAVLLLLPGAGCDRLGVEAVAAAGDAAVGIVLVLLRVLGREPALTTPPVGLAANGSGMNTMLWLPRLVGPW